MIYFLILYLAIQILSFGLLPLTTKLFSSLSDKGYAFSKSVSPIIIGFAVWFLVSLNLFQFTHATLVTVSLILIAISYAFVGKWRNPFSNLSRRNILYIIFIEFLFLFIFASTAYLKYLSSPIRGTEKPMDFALINGIVRSEYFPPNDAWYAGKTINYYYYGHYIIAFLSKISGIPSNIIYTLALPLVFSLTGLNIFGLVFNAVKKKSTATIFGLLATTLVLFGANFDTPIQIIKSFINGVKPVISWWDPSRVIGRGFLPNSYITITEFPYFSLLLGDVHAHVLALVLGSLLLGICLAFILSFRAQSRNPFPLIIFGSLVLASLAMTNPWEIPGYILLAIFILLIPPLRVRGGLGGVIIGLGSLLLFSFPFINNFEMIRAVSDPKPIITFISNIALIGRRTLLSEFLTIWGTHLFVITVALVVIIKKFSPRRFLFFRLPRITPVLTPELIFSLITILTGIFLLVFCEFFFINDFFTAPSERMNTVFKLYFQAWVVLGAGGLILLGNTWDTLSKIYRSVIAAILAILMMGNFTYFVFATPVRLNEQKGYSPSLDGLKYREKGAPSDQGDLAAIKWFNDNIKDQVNIVESAIDPTGGNSYNQIGRISAATGLPAVLGWYAVNHEAGWRNENSDVYQRVSDVNKIYLSNNLSEVRPLLSKYQIKYIFIGQTEREAYPGANFDKFSKLGKLVFSHPYSQIYEITPL